MSYKPRIRQPRGPRQFAVMEAIKTDGSIIPDNRGDEVACQAMCDDGLLVRSRAKGTNNKYEYKLNEDLYEVL